ncbi:GNAT family N-acetyltransferase [Microbacterium sp. AZCO]|uniref:GNAT family N-acetyltransferase n=1 Tax=Microbacterium sp. AZCO TaxID=3142976 RepID=UPI0031F3D8DD
MSATFREADLSDIPVLARMRSASTSEGGSPLLVGQADYERRLGDWLAENRRTHRAFIAVSEADGNAIGMTWLAVQERVPTPGVDGVRTSADIQSVYVDPEFRGQGIGRKLVEYVMRVAAAEGVEHVTVHSRARAVPMYKRAGFEQSTDLLWWQPR